MKKKTPKCNLSIEDSPIENKKEKKHIKLGIIKGKNLKMVSFRMRPEAIEAAHFLKEYMYQKTNFRLPMTQIVESLLMWANNNPVKMRKILKI